MTLQWKVVLMLYLPCLYCACRKQSPFHIFVIKTAILYKAFIYIFIFSAVKMTVDELVNASSQCNSIEVSILNNAVDFLLRSMQLNAVCPGIQTLKPYDLDHPIMVGLAQCGTTFTKSLEDVVYSPKYGFYDMCTTIKDFHSCTNTTLTGDTLAHRLLRKGLGSTLHMLQEFIKFNCEIVGKLSL